MRYIGERHFPPFEATGEQGWWTDGQREWFGPRPPGKYIKPAAVKREVLNAAAQETQKRRLIDPWRKRG